MRINIRELKDYTIQAVDGHIGQAEDFYFDDRTWAIRNVVVDTGKWLTGRLVLVSPDALKPLICSTQILPVGLTRDQIENSPNASMDKPVTLQKEEELAHHYRWPRYWGGTDPLFPAPRDLELVGPVGSTSQAAVRDREALAQEHANPHVRSTNAIIGYSIEADDGTIDFVKDLIVDDSDWTISYVAVELRNWLEDKVVYISTERCKKIDWARSLITTTMTTNEIEYSPDYLSTNPLTSDFGVKLF